MTALWNLEIGLEIGARVRTEQKNSWKKFDLLSRHILRLISFRFVIDGNKSRDCTRCLI